MDPKIVNDNDREHGRLDEANLKIDILEPRMDAIIQAFKGRRRKKSIEKGTLKES